MSYDPPYRPSTGYADQQWPAEQQWPEEAYFGRGVPEQAGFSDTFDGGQRDYGVYPDLPSTAPAGSPWQDEFAPAGPAAPGSPAELVRRSRGVLTGAVMGFLAAAVAIGVATLAAAFFRPQASPVIAVGEAFIDRTPAALKEFAIQKFGEHDKTALLIGMYVTIGLLAMVIGVLARRRTFIGVVGVTVFGLFGAFVAYTRPASKVSDVIPSLIGGIAGVAALLWLASAAGGSPTAGRPYGGRA